MQHHMQNVVQYVCCELVHKDSISKFGVVS